MIPKTNPDNSVNRSKFSGSTILIDAIKFKTKNKTVVIINGIFLTLYSYPKILRSNKTIDMIQREICKKLKIIVLISLTPINH